MCGPLAQSRFLSFAAVGTHAIDADVIRFDVSWRDLVFVQRLRISGPCLFPEAILGPSVSVLAQCVHR